MLDTALFRWLMSRSNPVSHRIMELYDQWDRGCDYAISGETLARTLPGKIKPETVRPGKLPGFLLKDEPFTASELEVFVNDFKATFCVAGQYEFTLVDGPDIAALYDGDEHQYIDDVHTSSGLEGSCMNGKHDFLGLYYENGKKVQGLKVIYSKTGLIAARALLWHTDQGIIVLDRIYACRPVLTELVCKYARSKGWHHKAEQNFELNSRFVSEGLVDSVMYLSVSGVNEPLNDAWPYMDTFCYYEDGKLSNQSPTDEHSFRTLRRDNGMYRYTHGCVFVDTMHGRVPQSRSAWSAHHNCLVDTAYCRKTHTGDYVQTNEPGFVLGLYYEDDGCTRQYLMPTVETVEMIGEIYHRDHIDLLRLKKGKMLYTVYGLSQKHDGKLVTRNRPPHQTLRFLHSGRMLVDPSLETGPGRNGLLTLVTSRMQLLMYNGQPRWLTPHEINTYHSTEIPEQTPA